MEYRYLERALIELHNVTENVSAFKGRIRHLLMNEVVAVHRPGKGTRLSYCYEEMLTIHVALLLHEIGLTPASITNIMKCVKVHCVNGNFNHIVILRFNNERSIYVSYQPADAIQHCINKQCAIVLYPRTALAKRLWEKYTSLSK